jgi:hypothetical protein
MQPARIEHVEVLISSGFPFCHIELSVISTKQHKVTSGKNEQQRTCQKEEKESQGRIQFFTQRTGAS